jgi:hypothetical protein
MRPTFAMEVKVPIVSEQGQQEQRREPRRSVRAGNALRMIVADKAGLVCGQVIDITTRGCGLRLTKSLTPGQYLTLKMYPINGTTSVQCDLVKVQWVEEDRAGGRLPVDVAGERASIAATLWRSACLRIRGVDAHGTFSLCVRRGGRGQQREEGGE